MVEFQIHSVPAPDLVSATYSYIFKDPTLTHLPLLPSDFPPRDISYIALSIDTISFTSVQDHLLTWAPPIPILYYRSHANSILGHLVPLLVTPDGFLSP